ncbi:MAG: NTP transferase domain-containing protein, partial [Steroidobacteraceae bacterium]
PRQATLTAPLHGLVLTGGRSARMGRDKAELRYAGEAQLDRAMALVAARTSTSFISVRPDQVTDPMRLRYPQIVDRHEDLGPIAGIMAAQAQHSDAAWLVVACDLPFLDAASLDNLLTRRAPQRMATAYRSAREGLPEPLCAIFEPACREPIERFVASGNNCPRKFLMIADTELLDLPNPRALDNVNTPEEFAAANGALQNAPAAPAATATRRALNVQYFALLREQAGRNGETVETTAGTPRELYEELLRRHRFTLAPEMLRVAVNSEFADWSQRLAAGDTIVFIPPVAGG